MKEFLNSTEKMFVREYFKCNMDHCQAAENALVSRSAGAGILRREHVQLALSKHFRGLVLKGVIATPEQVLQGFTQDAEFDPRELVNEDGNFIPLQDLPDSAAKALAGFKCKERIIKREEDGSGAVELILERAFEYKFPDRHKNRESLGKYHGIFEKDNRQKALTADILKQILACLPAEIRETVVQKLGEVLG